MSLKRRLVGFDQKLVLLFFFCGPWFQTLNYACSNFLVKIYGPKNKSPKSMNIKYLISSCVHVLNIYCIVSKLSKTYKNKHN